MKKIIFKGLGPTGNAIYRGEDKKEKIIKNGAIIEMEEEKADAYINIGLAYEVINEQEAIKVQNQVLKNKARREEVIKAAEKKKEGKK